MPDEKKRSADDTAADMERRLKDLEHEVEDAGRAQRNADQDKPLIHLAGDQSEERQGQHSAGSTLKAAPEPPADHER